jgi:hypothetical protein
VPQPRRPGAARVVFDDAFWLDDLARTDTPGRRVAEDARRQFEADGVPVAELRACDAEGRDGTRLPGCVKVYLPLPYGEHGMVFEINRQQGRLVLLCLAVGERHPTGRPSVYQIADKRLHRAERGSEDE